jgi:glycine oxidase
MTTERHSDPMGRPTADVVIVGGGVIGCAIALEVAEAGRSVVVIEPGEPGAAASSAAAGMLAPQSETQEGGPFLDLALASLALFPALAQRLLEYTGTDVGFRTPGMLRAVLDEAEVGPVRHAVEWQRRRGLDGRWLDRADARNLEPALGDDVLGAALFAQDAQVDNALLARALAQAAVAKGARFVLGHPVTRFRREGSRVTGVDAGPTRVDAGVTVLAAGAWSGALAATLGISVPVRPAKGQMLQVGLLARGLGRILASSSVYLVPRPGGRVLVGATVEDAGFDTRVTLEAVAGLSRDAIRLCPALGDGTVERTWAGLRPRCPDDLPVLGPVPGLDGLVLASGHFRNGILLAPITARLIADLVLTGRVGAALAPFGVARFTSRHQLSPSA